MRVPFPGVLAVLLSSQLCLAAPPAAAPLPQAGARAVAPSEGLWPEEQRVIELFERAKPSVVFITTVVMRRDPFSLNVMEIPQGAGSGFIWDDEGHIVTNYHVIENAGGAQVTLPDHSTWDATLVGTAPDKDMAVLKIEAPKEKLKPIKLGSSKDLRVGQKVFAIGDPFGLDYTLTTGIISALGREIQSVTRRPIQGVIQTDAAINPGNSGGPLLDSSGRLIGINTAIYSPSGASSGIGFAVPVDNVLRFVPQLIRSGKVSRAGFGISVAQDVWAERLGVKGVLILDVDPRGAAAQAGLRPTRRDGYGAITLGDVIVSVDGKALDNNDELYRLLDAYEPGAKVTVGYLREGRRQNAELTLQALTN